jgi:hypothetical protein
MSDEQSQASHTLSLPLGNDLFTADAESTNHDHIYDLLTQPHTTSTSISIDEDNVSIP